MAARVTSKRKAAATKKKSDMRKEAMKAYKKQQTQKYIKKTTSARSKNMRMGVKRDRSGKIVEVKT